MDQNVILFDLDGTLTDSAEGIVNSVVYALERMGIPYESKESLRCFIGPPLQASFGDIFKLSEEQVQDAVRLFRTYFREKGIYENSVYENIPEMLSALRNAGYTLAVATSKPEAFAEQIPDTTKLIIAQRVASVQEADLIVVLDGGKIAAVGNHESLMQTSEIYREVYESQVKGGEE